MSPELAWRIGGALGEDPRELLRQQAEYDLAQARPPRPVAAMPQIGLCRSAGLEDPELDGMGCGTPAPPVTS